jgi:hypothetical protein
VLNKTGGSIKFMPRHIRGSKGNWIGGPFFDTVKGHLCDSYFLTRDREHLKSLQGSRSAAGGAFPRVPSLTSQTPKPFKLPAQPQERATAYSRRRCSKRCPCPRGRRRRGCLRRLDSAPSRSRRCPSLSPLPRFLIGFACLLGGFWGLAPG